MPASSISNVNFIATATPSTHSISGTITSSGVGLPGVTASLFGTSTTTATDVGGQYSFTGLADGSYTVTASKSGYTFSPASRSETIGGANVTGVDFIATTALSTRYLVRFSTVGATTAIGTINMTVQLPAGVTAKSTISPPETDPGVAFVSGNATSSELFISTYNAAPRTVNIQLGSVYGFANGEFATIACELAPGVNPSPADFTILSFSSWDVNTAVIPGVTNSVGVSPAPSSARLKLVATGTTETITGVDVTIQLPAGVNIRSSRNPPAADPGVVFASGDAAQNSLAVATYAPATRTVHVALINLDGFSSGEFATVMCDLAPAVSPTVTDFIIQAATIHGMSSTAVIPGASVDRSVTLE